MAGARRKKRNKRSIELMWFSEFNSENERVSKLDETRHHTLLTCFRRSLSLENACKQFSGSAVA